MHTQITQVDACVDSDGAICTSRNNQSYMSVDLIRILSWFLKDCILQPWKS